MNAILQQLPADLAQFRPDTPPALLILIEQMLQKEAQSRPGSMRQIAARPDEIQSRLPKG